MDHQRDNASCEVNNRKMHVTLRLGPDWDEAKLGAALRQRPTHVTLRGRPDEDSFHRLFALPTVRLLSDVHTLKLLDCGEVDTVALCEGVRNLPCLQSFAVRKTSVGANACIMALTKVFDLREVEMCHLTPPPSLFALAVLLEEQPNLSFCCFDGLALQEDALRSLAGDVMKHQNVCRFKFTANNFWGDVFSRAAAHCDQNNIRRVMRVSLRSRWQLDFHLFFLRSGVALSRPCTGWPSGERRQARTV
jgi:hypothetical protein